MDLKATAPCAECFEDVPLRSRRDWLPGLGYVPGPRFYVAHNGPDGLQCLNSGAWHSDAPALALAILGA